MNGDRPLRIGVSRCLLGVRCRYDGKAAETRVDAPGVVLVDVCPEVELGMGVPREAVRLEGEREAPRMIGIVSRTDHTERMRAFAGKCVAELRAAGLDGFVLQSRSPSCGVGSVKRFASADAEPVRDGTGLFAAALRARLPDLPVIEDDGFADPARWAAFLEAVRRHRRHRERR